MAYDNPHDEAIRLETLAKDDLKQHSNESAKALLNETLSVPDSEVWKVNKELRNMGSVSDTNCPEVFIDTRETQRNDMVNGRQKITIGERPVGVVASGSTYSNWYSWSKEGSTRYLYDGSAPRTTQSATELYPGMLRGLWNAIF